jgi:uncharacterized protein (DUF169 family)
VNWEKVDEIVREYLGIKYHLVGVKLRKTGTQGKNPLKPEKPMAFCQMVRIASQTGKVFLYDETDEKCPTGELCLGFREPIYMEIEPRVKPADTKSVLVAPLNRIEEEPDVILVTLNSKQMMDLTAILLVEKQNPLHVVFKSEAACGDFLARPYMEKRPNLSFLCSGARLYADFRDSDLIFGAPSHFFIQAAETIERIEKTSGALCGCRTSDLPPWIVGGFEKIGFARGTDYFFGKIKGYNVRIYLNKDFQGKPSFITVHIPIKMSSEVEAENSVNTLKSVLSRPFQARQRGNWVDLFMTVTLNELGADLDGESIMLALKEITDNMIQVLQSKI